MPSGHETRWTVRGDLGAVPGPRRRELWEAWRGQERLAGFPVEVFLGKPLNVLALKDSPLSEVVEYAGFLARTAERLYAPGGPRRSLTACPCCDAPREQAAPALTVFGVDYLRCGRCGHGFVGDQPSAEVLAEVFAESDEHSTVYTDARQIETRLAEVVMPKVGWTLERFRENAGGAPSRALDVGAGGGHFLEGLRRAGVPGEGYELSRSSRAFARQAFGLELRAEDFLAAPAAPGQYDLITFWGLLEYTPEPRRFLEAARRRLSPGRGMLVVEVPRLACLGTAVQALTPATVARHLDPTSHVNTFSDASLAQALWAEGFKPVAAWYFGMDAYELMVQLALKLGDHAALPRLAELIPGLQEGLDQGRLCDDLVVAAVPVDRPARQG